MRKLKRIGTVLSYPRPTDKSEYNLSGLAFSDSSKPDDYGQVGVIIGILVGPLKKDEMFHAISWVSHKSKLPEKGIPAAEILAAAESIDEFYCYFCTITT